MGTVQRYVSDELTHFVGRGLSEARQYETLLRVLRTGRLSPPPHDGSALGEVLVRPEVPVSGNGAFEPEAVCFCDIPTGDLHLHIRKYSPFGVAFRKPLVVAAGANPVFYVARASTTRSPEDGDARPRTRAERFDESIAAYHGLRVSTQRRLESIAGAGADADADADEARLLEGWLRFAHFLDVEVLSFLKFFQYPADDAQPDNYYMEREWRLRGDMAFRLEDVRRVVLPEPYAQRFRRDVPEYAGQLTYAEGFV